MFLGNEAWMDYNSPHSSRYNLKSTYRKNNESTVIIPDLQTNWDQTISFNEESSSHSHTVPLWQ